MNVQRSTNHHHLSGGFSVKLEVSRLGVKGIELFYSWVEIWLFRHCKAGWQIETLEYPSICGERNRTFLQVTFDDVREALYFKMSPEYLRGQSPPIGFLLAA